jgi:hypothetical protein
VKEVRYRCYHPLPWVLPQVWAAIPMAAVILTLVLGTTGRAAVVPTSRSLHPAPTVPATRESLAARLERLSARYLGTTYGRDPLGEGAGAQPDPDPLINRACVDCQTYVEQVLAEALAARPSEVLPLLTRIRYRDGVIGFGTRNHYMVTDWLPHNRWLIRDVTEEVGRGATRGMEKVIDRAAFFQARGAPELGVGIAPEVSRTTYIPREGLPSALPRIPSGAVLIWVQDRPGIIAAHCGFAFQRPGGEVRFRHASERRGRVVDEPLLAYLQRAPARIIGVKVCQVLPQLDTGQRHR